MGFNNEYLGNLRRKGEARLENIRIKYFSDEIERLRYIDGKSDWIDLRASETVVLKKGEYKLIPLGVAMALPEGYEAHVVPRSSTFKNFGIIQTNSQGVIVLLRKCLRYFCLQYLTSMNTLRVSLG